MRVYLENTKAAIWPFYWRFSNNCRWKSRNGAEKVPLKWSVEEESKLCIAHSTGVRWRSLYRSFHSYTYELWLFEWKTFQKLLKVYQQWKFRTVLLYYYGRYMHNTTSVSLTFRYLDIDISTTIKCWKGRLKLKTKDGNISKWVWSFFWIETILILFVLIIHQL